MKQFSIAIVIAFFPLILSAQELLTVSGSYTYYAPTNITLDYAKVVALERAKNEIIAERFGTVVGVRNFTEVENKNGESSVNFLSLGENEVKGEWIETIGKPEYEVSYGQNMQIVKVSVKGKIREIRTARIDFDAKILRNGTDERYESDTFKDGDDIYIQFQSPEDGYLAIFLYDKDGVNRLLPEKKDKDGSFRIEKGRKYVMFETTMTQYSFAQDRTFVTTKSIYNMTCDSETELNRIYLVFSPNRFSHPNDNIDVEDYQLASLSFEAFQKWLARCRRQDNDMVLQIRDITISKR